MFIDKDYSYYDGFPKRYSYIRNKNFGDWEIPPWNLLVDRNQVLGKGNFGIVYKAFWNHTEVVAKVINENISDEKKQLFLKELDVLTKIHHPNIVQVLGYVSDPFIIVMEYLPKGDLHKYRYNNRLTIIQKLIICTDVLKALVYLHNRKPEHIVHRDLKPQNIVLSASGRAKIADFGISRIINSNLKQKLKSSSSNEIKGIVIEWVKEFKEDSSELTKFVGSYRYMSPEIKNGEEYNYKVDIWSTGIIFAELFEELRYSDNFYWRKTPEDIRELIIKYMLREQPVDRLNSKELLDHFLRLENKYKHKFKPGISCGCFASIKRNMDKPIVYDVTI